MNEYDVMKRRNDGRDVWICALGKIKPTDVGE